MKILMPSIKLGTRPLRLEDIREVALGSLKVELAPKAVTRIRASEAFLLREIQRGKTMYGVNTGFGYLSNVRIQGEDLQQLQLNILRSHATGVGDPISESAGRAMLLLRANSLAQGNSGCRVSTVRQILELLNRKITPFIPEQGSVGASGDLCPLAHLALVLIGEGKAYHRGKLLSGAAALKAAKLKPIELGPKEGLALINGTQFMTAIGVLALLDAEHLCDVADFVGGLSLESLRGTATPFDPLIHGVRPHSGQTQVAKRLRKILNGRPKSQILESHRDCDRVQDAYSLRCIPQVHGATRDALAYVRQVLEIEVDSVTDNPLVFPEKRKILSGGNFHGQVVSMALDLLAIAVAELASISEQRFQKLINPSISELPTFLTPESGLNSGFMMTQVAAASIVSENKTLTHPACVDSIPTNVDKEDHVSMGAWAARKAMQVVVNTRRVLAMELLAGCQGIDLLRPLKTSSLLEKLHRRVRKGVSKLEQDRVLDGDIRFAEELIQNRSLEPIVAL